MTDIESIEKSLGSIVDASAKALVILRTLGKVLGLVRMGGTSKMERKPAKLVGSLLHSLTETDTKIIDLIQTLIEVIKNSDGYIRSLAEAQSTLIDRIAIESDKTLDHTRMIVALRNVLSPEVRAAYEAEYKRLEDKYLPERWVPTKPKPNQIKRSTKKTTAKKTTRRRK